MKIIVAGLGKVGYALARTLDREGHDVTVIDRSSDVIQRASNEMDVICVEGNAAHPETLKEAGAAEADLLIACVSGDEANMISCISARKLGTKNVIARIRDPEYLPQSEFLREVLGLSMTFNPEYEYAREVGRILHFPGAGRVDAFSKGSVNIIEHKVPEGSRLVGVSLRELSKVTDARVLISLAERKNEVIIPNGAYTFEAGDKLSITGSTSEMRRFFTDIGAYKKPVKHVIMMGGGKAALYLGGILSKSGISVTLIERDPERCRELSEKLPEAVIINGDATYVDVLDDEGLSRADAFVAISGEDGDNIIASLYARKCGVGKIVTKVNRIQYSDILAESGLDSVGNSSDIVIQQLSRYVRALEDSANNMETLYKLAGGKAEAVEFIVSEGFKGCGITLSKLKLKDNVLVASVIRGKDSLVPNGTTTLEPGDHVVLVALADDLKKLSDILAD